VVFVNLDHSQKREEEEENKNKNKVEQSEKSDLNEDLENNEENNELNRSTKYKPNSIVTQESNASLIIQTETVEDNNNPPEEKKKVVSYRITGTIFFIVGNLFTFGAFGFGAQSLLASLESIQFVSNLFFVRFVHKETVTIRMIVATLSIIARLQQYFLPSIIIFFIYLLTFQVM
jgi:hypothetical protein